MTSRFITYPSTVEKTADHTVILIDATLNELTQLERFLQTSNSKFDVYIYQETTDDLEWLSYISQVADQTLINSSSRINLMPKGIQYQTSPLDYFEQIEKTFA
jgi:hypothetical protein